MKTGSKGLLVLATPCYFFCVFAVMNAPIPSDAINDTGGEDMAGRGV